MLNCVILQGNLGSDPELRVTTSGVKVASVNLAVSRDKKTNEQQETDWVSLVAFGNTAEFLSKYFYKGRMVIVKGRLQIRNYTASDGSNRSATEVLADQIYFAGDREKSGSTHFEAPKTGSNDLVELEGPDDLPF